VIIYFQARSPHPYLRRRPRFYTFRAPCHASGPYNIEGRIRGGRGVGNDGGIGKGDGFVLHLFPGFKLVFEVVFLFEVAKGDEKEFADEGEGGCVARRDAILGDGLEELAENEIDVCGSHEWTGNRRGELGAEKIGFDDLALGAGVEDAQRRMISPAKHAASAAVSELELAEAGLVDGNEGTGFL